MKFPLFKKGKYKICMPRKQYRGMFQGFCIIKNQENSAEKQVEKLLISFPKGQIQHFYVKTRRGPMLLLLVLGFANEDLKRFEKIH